MPKPGSSTGWVAGGRLSSVTDRSPYRMSRVRRPSLVRPLLKFIRAPEPSGTSRYPDSVVEPAPKNGRMVRAARMLPLVSRIPATGTDAVIRPSDSRYCSGTTKPNSSKV